jgi:hypothetical protein
MDGHWVSYFNFYLSLAKTKQNCGLVICAHWMICCVVYWLHRCLLVRLMYISFIHSTLAQHRLSSIMERRRPTCNQPEGEEEYHWMQVVVVVNTKPNQTKPKWPTPIGTTNIALCFALIKLTWLVLRL